MNAVPVMIAAVSYVVSKDELIDIAMNTDDGIDVAADDLDDDDDISEI